MSTMMNDPSEARIEERIPMASASRFVELTADRTRKPACDVRILIVDDNPDVLQMVSKMTQYLGYQTTTAEDALMALYHLRKSHFDVVITDYDMPFINGYELADQIKETHFGTRVIIMTGHCKADVVDIIRSSGVVNGLLFKPFNMQAIEEEIENAL